MGTFHRPSYVDSVERFERERKIQFCKSHSNIPRGLMEKIWLQQENTGWPDAGHERAASFVDEIEAFIKRLEDRGMPDVRFWRGILTLYNAFEANYDPKGIFLCLNGVAFIDVGQEEKFFNSMSPEAREHHPAPAWVEFGRILNLPEYQEYLDRVRELEQGNMLADEDTRDDLVHAAFIAEEALKTLYVNHPFGHKESYTFPHVLHGYPSMLWCILLLLHVDTDDLFKRPDRFCASLEKISRDQFLNVFQFIALYIWIPYCFQDVLEQTSM